MPKCRRVAGSEEVYLIQRTLILQSTLPVIIEALMDVWMGGVHRAEKYCQKDDLFIVKL